MEDREYMFASQADARIAELESQVAALIAAGREKDMLIEDAARVLIELIGATEQGEPDDYWFEFFGKVLTVLKEIGYDPEGK